MANFAYYIPEGRPLYRKANELPGELPSILHGLSLECRQLGSGPAGTRGTMITTAPVVGESFGIDYLQEDQQWVPAGEPVEYWIGMRPESPPRPEELLRGEVVTGDTVLLAGHEWHVPIVHIKPSDEADPFTTLPRRVVFESGKPVLKPREQYRWIIELAGREFDSLMEHERWTLGELEMIQFGVAVLGVNYRVGMQENAILDLIDTQNRFVVPRAALGMALAQKKMDGAGVVT